MAKRERPASTSDELERRLAHFFPELSDSDRATRAVDALPVPLGSPPIDGAPVADVRQPQKYHRA